MGLNDSSNLVCVYLRLLSINCKLAKQLSKWQQVRTKVGNRNLYALGLVWSAERGGRRENIHSCGLTENQLRLGSA